MVACRIGERGVLLLPPSGFKSFQWHAHARVCASACKKQVEPGASPGQLSWNKCPQLVASWPKRDFHRVG